MSDSSVLEPEEYKGGDLQKDFHKGRKKGTKEQVELIRDETGIQLVFHSAGKASTDVSGEKTVKAFKSAGYRQEYFQTFKDKEVRALSSAFEVSRATVSYSSRGGGSRVGLSFR